MPGYMKEEQARAWLLERIRQGVVESKNAGEDVLTLRPPDFEQFGHEMGGWTVPEVSGLYKRLVRGGFLRQVRGEMEFVAPRGILEYAWVEDLTDKGYQAIGMLHDPADRRATALVAARKEVAASEDIPEDEKPSVLDWLDRGIALARVVEGAAQILTKHL